MIEDLDSKIRLSLFLLHAERMPFSLPRRLVDRAAWMDRVLHDPNWNIIVPLK